MPTFNPPLSDTSLVPAALASGDPSWCLLTFKATFDQHEDTSGRYEIWTDLPALDPNGQPLTAPGEWHAVPFTPIPTPTTAALRSSDETPISDNTGRIRLEPACKASTSTSSATTTLHATVIIDPPAGASYAYTFRHVHPSSDSIHWLGGEGSNGVIQVSAEAPSAPAGDQGMGLSFGANGRPTVQLLPSSNAVAAKLAVISGFSGESAPFARIIRTLQSKYTAVARPALQAFDISPEEPFGPSDTRTALQDSPSGALVALLEAVGGNGIKVAHTHSADGSDTKDVLAFTVSEDGKDSLVVYTSALSKAHDVDVHLPELNGGPWVLSSPGIQGLIYSEEGVIPIRLSPGQVVSQVLNITTFEALPLSHGTSLYVSAPEAVSSYIQSAPQLTKSNAHVASEVAVEETKDEDEDEDEEESESFSSAADVLESINQPSTMSGASIFSAIEGFFFSLWAWIFGYVAPVTDSTDDESDISEEDDETPAAESKLDSISRVTSDSGLHPSPPPVGSPLPNLETTSNPAPSQSGPIETSVGLGPSIRYTFKSSPPFKFFLPPGGDVSARSLRFRVKSAESDWSVIQSTSKTADGACTEVEVNPEGHEGQTWEVSLDSTL